MVAVFLVGCADPTRTGREDDGSSVTRVDGVDGFYHTVRSGETLSAIAYRHGVSAHGLAKINNIRNMNKIRVGQKILIPRQETVSTSSGTTKTIGSGSTGLVRGTGSLVWPVSGKPISGYGATNSGLPRHGIVISAAPGTAVKAADSGNVVISCDWMRGYGRTVVIDHGNDMTTMYANNSELLVRQGESVKKGQTIARSGSSGGAAGGQVEFRVYRGGIPQDPRRYLGR